MDSRVVVGSDAEEPRGPRFRNGDVLRNHSMASRHKQSFYGHTLVFPNPALSCTFIHTCVEAQTAYPDSVYSSPLTSPQAWEFAHHWPSLPPEDRPGEEDHRGAESGLQGPRYQGHDLEGLVQALVGHIRKTCSDEARGDLRCVALLSG